MNPIGDHFYTTSAFERDNAIAKFGYVDEGVACFVLSAPPATATQGPLFRLLSQRTGDHFYTTSAFERDNAIAKFGYVSEGIACDVFSSPQADSVPLFRAYNSDTGDHFYTTSGPEIANAIAKFGYQNEGIACHVPSETAPGSIPLHRLLGPKGDHFYTTSIAERDNAVNAFGYQSEGVACHVLPPTSAAIVPLFRMFLGKTGDHFFTTSGAERDNAITSFGYQDEGIAAWVFASPSPGTTPLLRAYNPGNGDHFYTTSAAEHANAVANINYVDEGVAGHVLSAATVAGAVPFFRLYKRYGAQVRLHLKVVQNYVSEGIACNVFSAPGVGRVPLLRALSSQNGDHFYTTSAAEHANALATFGYVDEGTACWVPSSAGPLTTPLLRARHPANGDHFYTTSAAEHANAIAQFGYIDEGTACQVFAGAQADTVPLHRLFNAATGDHFYTTSANERDTAIANLGPTVPVMTMISSAQAVYDQAHIQVFIASQENISAPDAVDVDVGACSGDATTDDQDALFENRNFVRDDEMVVYFVRATTPPNNGCATHPRGKPGAVVSQVASQWSMAHEVGHLLGLSHLAKEDCSVAPTRLMTSCSTSNIVVNPATLIDSEIATMDDSSLSLDI